MKSVKTDAKQMIVRVSPVRMAERVKINLMAICVIVKRDSVGSAVRMTLVLLFSVRTK